MTRTVENYEQAVEYLYGRINYERVQSDRYALRDFKLERMAELLTLIGSPQDRIPVVHIAGTKGKGSTAVMVAEVLQAAGYRVGLFTSPHLEVFEERMRVNGRMPTATELVELVNQVGPSVATLDRKPGHWNPTYFEITTAIAWLFFEHEGIDMAVLEVGLGGRLDSTNVCRSEVCAITSISRDHTHLLGEKLAQIAAEKAGIIKAGIPVVAGCLPDEASAVVSDVCQRQKAQLYRLDHEVRYQYPGSRDRTRHRGAVTENRVRSDVAVYTPWNDWPSVPLTLLGQHQAANAAVAVGMADVLKERGWSIASEAVYRGMSRVRCPLRIEVLSERPYVIVDAAHNLASLAALTTTLSNLFPTRRRLLVFATARDKDVPGHLRQLLPQFDTIILTQYLGNPRALPVDELACICRSMSDRPVHCAAHPSQAWKLARRLASEDDLICVTGSFFIAAEVRFVILDESHPSEQDASSDSQLKPGLVH